MNVDLNRLKIFKEVVLAGSFSKAAAKLHQPKSRVSRQMQALETELGVQLVYRTTRQFQLTPAGLELFQRTQPLLAELQGTLELVATAAEEVSGPLRVTVPEDIGVELMGDICHEFLLTYPKVAMEVQVTNQVVDLVRDSFDVGLRFGKMRDSTLLHRKLGAIHLLFVISPDLAQRHGVTKLADLEKLPYLAFGALTPRRRVERVTNSRETRALNLETAFASSNFFVLRDMAIRGAGLTMLPPFVARAAIDAGKLIPVFKEWQTEGAALQVVMPHQKEVPMRITRFIEFLARKLASSL